MSIVLALIGCGTETAVNTQTGSDTWQQAENNEVDILWVIDDSYSMAAEQQALADGFGDFIAEMEATGTDFHLGVITTSFEADDPDRGKLIGDPAVITSRDDYVTLFQERVIVGTGGSDKERGLQAALHALSPALTTTANSGFLRSEAQLLVSVVSDEEDCSDNFALEGAPAEDCYKQPGKLIPIEEVVGDLRDLKASDDLVQLGGIVGPKQGCQDAVGGERYRDVAGLTGGLVGDICNADWGGMLFDLGLDAAGIKSRFQTSKPADVKTLVVTVDGEEVAESDSNGWTYDLDTWFLTFHNDAIPDRGVEITANYEVVPGIGQPGDEAPADE